MFYSTTFNIGISFSSVKFARNPVQCMLW